MGAPAEILELVERFERNRGAYCPGQYNETRVPCEFLDPFSKPLGWGFDNVQGCPKPGATKLEAAYCILPWPRRRYLGAGHCHATRR